MDKRTILGVDYGARRIGLAVSGLDGKIAVPLRVVEVSSDDEAIEAVAAAAEEKRASEIVLGMPRDESGRETEIAQRVRTFGSRLISRVAIPVNTWHEGLTTRRAEQPLIDAGVRASSRRGKVDASAAALILQSYLDNRAPT